MGFIGWNGGHGSQVPIKGPLWIYGENWWEDLDNWYEEEARIFAAFWLSTNGLAWQLRGE